MVMPLLRKEARGDFIKKENKGVPSFQATDSFPSNPA
jgi:hypothetical protein